MKTLKINHTAVFVSALATQFIPPLWYDKVFFGLRWMELNNMVEEDFANFDMIFGLTLSFATGLAAAYMIAWIFQKINVESGLDGLKYSLLIWLAFVFMEVATQNFFSLRSFELTLIDMSAVLIQYEIIGIILGVWRKYSNNLSPEVA
ncbi:MAG: DUF1761 domain-containing protein [bacterium]|jgi:hypothetical protein|nr:DUF1761 domain-containing protein [bacterium]